MNGTYDVNAMTPMGAQTAKLVLCEEGGVLTGTFTLAGSENAITNGKADGDNFSFKCSVSVMGMSIAFDVTGAVDGDTLTASAPTPYGVIKMAGKKVG